MGTCVAPSSSVRLRRTFQYTPASLLPPAYALSPVQHMCVVMALPSHGSKLAQYERVKSKWERTESALRKHIVYHIRTEHVGSTIVLRIRMKDTKQHLCFVATGPLCSPEIVDERNLRTGEGLSDDTSEFDVMLGERHL